MNMKYALVTGGSRGIGRAVCEKLAAMGFHVLINYKSKLAEAEKTLELIRNSGGSGELLPFDVSNYDEVEKVLENWIESHKDGYIEVLVNNAGIRKDNLLMWMDRKEWQNVLSTNLDSFFFVSRMVIKDMLIKKFGRIINVVSLSGLKGVPGQVNYSAAKAGLIGATRSLAHEVARKKVTVNAVAPGFITTEMPKDLNEKKHKSMVPANRFGKPEEVAELVGFLASENSSYITGEVIAISGGLL